MNSMGSCPGSPLYRPDLKHNEKEVAFAKDGFEVTQISESPQKSAILGKDAETLVDEA